MSGHPDYDRAQEQADLVAAAGPALEHEPSYRLWVDEESTVLVRIWNDGRGEVATRGARWETWGPPTHVTEEGV